MSRRVRAVGLHLIASVTIALSSCLLVFWVWYPEPYAALAGGLNLFALLVSIDLVLGPVLTSVVANPGKPIVELRRDIVLIVVLQLLAFGYGMYTIALARPVHVVFEIDRFRIVSAVDVDPLQLMKAAPAYRQLSWTGPTMIAARKSATQEEMMHSLELGLQGVDIAMQPERWVDYAPYAPVVIKAARPVRQLLEKYPSLTNPMKALADNLGLPQEQLLFLPMDARMKSGVALITVPDARIVGYFAVDGFF